MFTLLRGLWKYFFRKDEYYVVILGLGNAGKTVSWKPCECIIYHKLYCLRRHHLGDYSIMLWNNKWAGSLDMYWGRNIELCCKTEQIFLWQQWRGQSSNLQKKNTQCTASVQSILVVTTFRAVCTDFSLTSCSSSPLPLLRPFLRKQKAYLSGITGACLLRR